MNYEPETVAVATVRFASNAHAAEIVRSLRQYGSRNGGDMYMYDLADQIEAQTKPPRIPEPGLWGVVRSLAGFEWVRTGPTQLTSREWLCENGARANWDELGSPVLIRPGIEEES